MATIAFKTCQTTQVQRSNLGLFVFAFYWTNVFL